jgi:hypothetical protein
MSDKKPTVYYFNRCIPVYTIVETEDEGEITVEGFFASHEPATQDSKAIICKRHYDNLQSKYDELLKESLEVGKFYGSEMNYSIDDYHGISGEMRRRCVLYQDCEERNDVYSYAGRRARDFLRKWDKK